MICCVGQVQFIWGLRGFNTYHLENQLAKLSNRGKHVILHFIAVSSQSIGSCANAFLSLYNFMISSMLFSSLGPRLFVLSVGVSKCASDPQLHLDALSVGVPAHHPCAC